MEIEKIVDYKPVKVTNNGMITIPSYLRKKYNIKDGDKVFIFEDEGILKIIPIKSSEELRKNSYTVEEMKKIMEETKREEILREL
ncbi:MAG: AbrB/MazE/SpoVT family DNA-binding domain-containing protein [Promethearchaeota archaeon]